MSTYYNINSGHSYVQILHNHTHYPEVLKRQVMLTDIGNVRAAMVASPTYFGRDGKVRIGLVV
jgi:hypothetical protein